MRNSRFIQKLTAIIMLTVFIFLPTAVHAAGSTAQADGSGVGIILALLALILILLGVIAVIGAVALGIIGIGYNSIQGDD